MLDSFRKGQRWLTLIFVTLIGGVFVLFMGVGDGLSRGGPSGSALIELGEIRLGLFDFERLRSQNEDALRDRLGEDFDAKTAGPYLDAQTLRTLEDGAILTHAARELGLMVSKREIQDLVLDSPSFRDEGGAFSDQAFDNFAVRQYGSQRNFVEMTKQELLRQKMVRVLFDRAGLSRDEARWAALYGLEQIRIGYVALDTESLPVGKVIEEAEIAAYLENHEDEVRGVYTERAALYARPEQISARHILLMVDVEGDEATQASARDEALAIRARLLDGEDFAVVASEVSQDQGTRDKGGDLGTFPRGLHVAGFDEAAFALEPGDISEPIQTSSGLHLILVDERIEAGTEPFEDVSSVLALELATRALAAEGAQETATTLADKVRDGRSLEEAVREQLLNLERTSLFSRRPDGFVQGLGAASELMAAAFALRPEEPSSARIFSVGPNLVLIQLLERSEPSSEMVEDAVLANEGRLLDEKRSQLIQTWLDDRRTELRESGQLLVNAELVLSDA